MLSLLISPGLLYVIESEGLQSALMRLNFTNDSGARDDLKRAALVDDRHLLRSAPRLVSHFVRDRIIERVMLSQLFDLKSFIKPKLVYFAVDVCVIDPARHYASIDLLAHERPIAKEVVTNERFLIFVLSKPRLRFFSKLRQRHCAAWVLIKENQHIFFDEIVAAFAIVVISLSVERIVVFVDHADR